MRQDRRRGAIEIEMWFAGQQDGLSAWVDQHGLIDGTMVTLRHVLREPS